MVARSDGSDGQLAAADDASDILPFSIDLIEDGTETAVRVLARAANASLARAIFKAAQEEHPGRHIALRRGDEIIASSRGS
jgi:hypothetical protein